MLDEYEEISGFHSPAAINDKPAEVNGTLGSMEATGTGVYFVTMEVVKDLGIPKNAKVVIQGFGNVGRIAARLLHQEGFKIIAVGDIKGCIYNPEGLDIPKLEEHALATGYVVGFPGAKEISTEELFALETDIIIPAAVQSVINRAMPIK